MLLVAGLVPLVVLATRVLGDPSVARDSLFTVPISKRISFNGAPDFTQRDRKRLRNLVKRVNMAPSIPLNNTGGAYVATIGVGEPATYCESCQFLPRMISYILTLR